jgi:hypothetical protein
MWARCEGGVEAAVAATGSKSCVAGGYEGASCRGQRQRHKGGSAAANGACVYVYRADGDLHAVGRNSAPISNVIMDYDDERAQTASMCSNICNSYFEPKPQCSMHICIRYYVETSSTVKQQCRACLQFGK